MARLLAALLLFCGVGVNLSKGVSVQVTVSGSILPTEEPTLDLDSIESLAASKILMDHTSSLSAAEATLAKVLKPSSASKVPVSVPLPLIKKDGRANTGSKVETNKEKSKQQENNEDVRSPLHVAQCRATCLAKFTPESTPTTPSGTTTVPSKAIQEYAATTSRSKLIAEELRLLPNLLRLKRSFDATNVPSQLSTCLQHSPECFSCWKSCQLLEGSTTSSSSGSTSSTAPSGSKPEAVFPSDSDSDSTTPTSHSNSKAAEVEVETGKGKQPGLACSRNGKACTEGCQVACGFYDKLDKNKVMSLSGSEPVVHTKQENVVEIKTGKIIWPKATSGQARSGPVVYVVIQEYPDRKWRQIAQTTDLELEIPAELTAAMKTKLRSVRVLVVGPEGLRSVYSASTDNNTEKANQVPGEGKTDKFGKSVVVAVNEETSTQTTTRGDAEAETEMGVVSASERSDSESAQVSPEKTGKMPEASVEAAVALEHVPASDISSTSTSTTTASSTLNPPAPFELRLVSLIHQKSLVIAELRWDPQGSNPNQEYLITWELTGGGLKGHLVTDSTSVTLSLWPDTTYQIQVAEFTQNLDTEGEQPENPESSTSAKSVPLIVDTSVASFPVQVPSALLLQNSADSEDLSDYKADSYSHDQDEFSAEEEDEQLEDEQTPGHKSLAQVLCVAVVSVIFVLAILTLVAFAWLKLRALGYSQNCVKSDEESAENCAGFSACFNGCCACAGDEKDVRLLISNEEGGQSPVYSSPLHFADFGNKSGKSGSTLECSFAQSSQHHGQQNQSQSQTPAVVQLPVAVISGDASSSLPASCYLSSGYYNGVFDYGNTSNAETFMAAEGEVASTWLGEVDHYLPRS